MTGYDVERVRKDFPVLSRVLPNGKPLVYLDSAATAQKPTAVLDALTEYYELHNANVHRGVHTLGEEATALYEGARRRVAGFLGAPDPDGVVFAKNATEGLNLLAQSLSAHVGLHAGDEVLVTEMEHHSNLVPWQLACERTGATLRWIRIDDDGRLDLSDLDALLTDRTKIVSFVHQSNILGTLNPVRPIVARAREVGALVVLDGSQSVPNRPVDVRELDVDFLVCTGHKIVGPTGIGVLWGRRDLLAAMPPFLGGGEMIAEVTMAGSTYAEPPHRFEAGTPPIAQAVGLAAACDYLDSLGRETILDHELEITGYALDRLVEIPTLRLIGPASTVDRGGAVSFTLEGIHPHDIGQVLDEHGVAVRVGHHCARPVCTRFGVPATTRASFGPYTTMGEIDTLVDGLHAVRRFFG